MFFKNSPEDIILRYCDIFEHNTEIIAYPKSFLLNTKDEIINAYPLYIDGLKEKNLFSKIIEAVCLATFLNIDLFVSDEDAQMINFANNNPQIYQSCLNDFKVFRANCFAKRHKDFYEGKFEKYSEGNFSIKKNISIKVHYTEEELIEFEILLRKKIIISNEELIKLLTQIPTTVQIKMSDTVNNGKLGFMEIISDNEYLYQFTSVPLKILKVL